LRWAAEPLFMVDVLLKRLSISPLRNTKSIMLWTDSFIRLMVCLHVFVGCTLTLPYVANVCRRENICYIIFGFFVEERDE